MEEVWAPEGVNCQFIPWRKETRILGSSDHSNLVRDVVVLRQSDQ